LEKKKVSYSDFISQLNGNNEEVEFENCIFEAGLVLNVGQKFIIKKNVVFKQCDFATLDFVNCDFKKLVYFHACVFIKGPIITNCNFTSRFIATHLKANSIKIWNNNFSNGCDILRYECKEEAIFQFGEVVGKIHIEQQRMSEALSVNKTNIQFENINNASIIITDISSKEVHMVFAGQTISLGTTLAGIEADKLEIFFLRNPANNKMNIDRVNANKITFHQLHNDGWLMIKSLKSKDTGGESLFRIQDSYLGNCELYHVDLASFQQIQILNCHLQNIVPVNVKWNFNIKAYEGIKIEYLRELFRQLKNVCSANMDKISQLRFERLEMHFYNQQLHWWHNFSDWIILKSNRYSNDYGQNWVYPILWLLSFSLLLYTILNYCYGSFVCYHVGNYSNFLMPFHNLKDVLCGDNKPIQNNWVFFWDTIQRIFSSYFIFQFLRAFRKYVN
jgi:hypothetical protein